MANSLNQFFATLVFRDVTASAGTQNTLSIKRFVVHRNNKYWKSGTGRLDILDQFQSALARKCDVGKHKIGLACVNSIERIKGIFRFGAYDEVRLVIDYVYESRARHRMIIDDQHTHPVCGWIRSIHRFILNVHSTVVPLPTAELIFRVAPIISARYCMIRKPSPPSALAPTGNSAPLFQILNVN